MKCKKCGAEFQEGIFCPECGTKADSVMVNSEEQEEREWLVKFEMERLEKEKALAEAREERAEKERLAKFEMECLAKEKTMAEVREEQEGKERLAKLEVERLANEKAIAEAKAVQDKAAAEIASNKNKELEARMYKGVMYLDESEARLAREEDNKIEILKQKLLTTKHQQKRQEMIAEFDDTLQISEAKKRFESLRVKANQKKPTSIVINQIYGVTIILAIVITAVLAVMELFYGIWETVMMVVALWYGIGIPVWIVWKIILVIQSRLKSYYLNIKDI